MSDNQQQAWTLRRAWDALRRSWLIILVSGVLVGAASFGLSSMATPVYQARATLFFSLDRSETVSELTQGSTYTQGQMVSFARLATSSRVLEPVVDELGLSASPRDLARSVSVVNPPGTVILELRASSTDPERSAAVANAVARSLTVVVGEVSSNAEDAPSITATLVDEAVVPRFQTTPNKTRDAMLGVILGGLLGVLIAFSRVLLDTRVRSTDVLSDIGERPVLGSVSRFRGEARQLSLVVSQQPMGAVAEDFRRVRSALTYSAVDRQLTRLLITSHSPQEGKSTFAANFALSLAELGGPVLLIDADLRRPRIGQYFGLEDSVGLTTVLMGEVALDDAVDRRPGTNLDVLVAGERPPNPAQLLTSQAMKALLSEAQQRYEAVLIDAPPLSRVADATLLAPLVDGVVVVVDSRKARRAWVAPMIASIESAGGHVAGLVLNRVRSRNSGYYSDDDLSWLQRRRTR